MSFYCKRYQKNLNKRKVFDYCMKRLPNGGKCNELDETKKGDKKRGNAPVDRDSHGSSILHSKMGTFHSRNYQEYAEMDS